MVPVWPKCSTPRGMVRWPATAPSHAKVAGWPSITVMRVQWGESVQKTFCVARSRIVPPCAPPAGGGPAGVEPVGRSDAQDADVAPLLHDTSRCGDRLRGDAALISDHEVTVRTRRPQPVGPVDDTLPKVEVRATQHLLDRPGRQSEVDRATFFVPEPGALVEVALTPPLKIIEGPMENN